jgi:putative spermidine/putrescine transport system ATP-binding protein
MADGAALKAVGAPPVGADLTLSVRPENIMLAGDHTQHGANLFSGTATDVFFLGDHMRLSVQAFGGQIVTARIPVAQSRSFQTGETVHLACMPADCRLLEG